MLTKCVNAKQSDEWKSLFRSQRDVHFSTSESQGHYRSDFEGGLLGDTVTQADGKAVQLWEVEDHVARRVNEAQAAQDRGPAAPPHMFMERTEAARMANHPCVLHPRFSTWVLYGNTSQDGVFREQHRAKAFNGWARFVSDIVGADGLSKLLVFCCRNPLSSDVEYHNLVYKLDTKKDISNNVCGLCLYFSFLHNICSCFCV